MDTKTDVIVIIFMIFMIPIIILTMPIIIEILLTIRMTMFMVKITIVVNILYQMLRTAVALTKTTACLRGEREHNNLGAFLVSTEQTLRLYSLPLCIRSAVAKATTMVLR